MKDLLKKARKLAMPSKKEKERVADIVRETIGRINKAAEKQKIKAKLVVGGSVAKDTWLPGLSDIDFFLKFNYDEYENLSGQLADFTERILKKGFKNIERIHGSRDYFNIKYDDFVLEIVPVLNIKSAKYAKNITDFSPLHVGWVKKHLKSKNDVRLAKQFFKANKAYGAESYIRGFSGHVIELLIIKYGSLKKLLEAIPKWKLKQIIDVGKRYKDKKNAIKFINEAKLHSPIIVVDPIQPQRNAAAALRAEAFGGITFASEKFAKQPSVKFFEEDKINLDKLRKKGALILKAKPYGDKKDIAGAKFLKNFKYLKSKLQKSDFKILEADWWWPNEGEAIYWFRFGKKKLSDIVIHKGPPLGINEQSVKRFAEKWKRRAKIKNKRYVVELKRKFKEPKKYLSHLIKDKELEISFVR